ncbi:MAG: sodium:solute symporter [Beijerinckiaceae bacterium]|nr:MAG: sodium:solute symporter [Beijerinckiaceae bacterium]
MDKATLHLTPGLTPILGWSLMIGLGLVLLILAYAIKRRLVKTTSDYIVSGRNVGLGFGVGAIISVWTWAMAVLMSSGMTYQWGLSGLFWFVVPNGFAVMAMVPLGRILKKKMPAGYTIAQFAFKRFGNSQVAAAVTTLTMIFGVLLEILINLKGTSIVMSTVFGINWRVAVLATVVIVLAYSYFGGLWTSMMTGTLNTFAITVLAAIIVVTVFQAVPGHATAVLSAVRAHDPQDLSITGARNWQAATGFGITLAFGLLASVVADQTFWQKVWAIQPRHVNRIFLLGGALFYPIPICLGMLGLVGIGYGLTLHDFPMGDVVAVGPYIVSHIGLPTTLVLIYVLVVLAACYSVIDGGSSALSSIVAVDIVKRYAPHTGERALFMVTRIAMLLGGIFAAIVVLAGADFTTLVLTTYALKTSILVPLVLAIIWPRTTTVGFVGGIALSILIGMPIKHMYGDLWGTLSIVAISAIVCVGASMLSSKRFDMDSLGRMDDELLPGGKPDSEMLSSKI